VKFLPKAHPYRVSQASFFDAEKAKLKAKRDMAALEKGLKGRGAAEVQAAEGKDTSTDL
jgi:hypothetical protein